MKLPVKYVFTHDTFRVGEDGPTHQPIEQETQLRLLEKMANLDGERSMLVVRPADVTETTVAWKMALEFRGPSALILSRQDVMDIPAQEGSTRFSDALSAARGAYIVKACNGEPDIVLVGNGSEVATLIEGAAILTKEKGLKVQVVSAPSEGVFNEQDPNYRETVLPFGVPTLALTAGLPLALQGLVGPLGKVIGLERLGASAPFKVLDEKFGYTASNVVKQVEVYLSEYADTLNRLRQSVLIS